MKTHFSVTDQNQTIIAYDICNAKSIFLPDPDHLKHLYTVTRCQKFGDDKIDIYKNDYEIIWYLRKGCLCL